MGTTSWGSFTSNGWPTACRSACCCENGFCGFISRRRPSTSCFRWPAGRRRAVRRPAPHRFVCSRGPGRGGDMAASVSPPAPVSGDGAAVGSLAGVQAAQIAGRFDRPAAHLHPWRRRNIQRPAAGDPGADLPPAFPGGTPAAAPRSGPGDQRRSEALHAGRPFRDIRLAAGLYECHVRGGGYGRLPAVAAGRGAAEPTDQGCPGPWRRG